jgi:hypothetical protein
MNKRLAAVAAVVLVGAVAVAVFGSRKRAASHPATMSSAESSHGVGMDRAMSAALAMYDASPGATPCETAYNAFQASVEYARTNGATPIVQTLAPRDEFLAKCGAQPPAVQQCLVPTYLAHNRDECEKVKPPADVVASMVVLKQVMEPAKGH